MSHKKINNQQVDTDPVLTDKIKLRQLEHSIQLNHGTKVNRRYAAYIVPAALAVMSSSVHAS